MTSGQGEPVQLNKALDRGQPLHHTRAIVRCATPCCDGIAGVHDHTCTQIFLAPQQQGLCRVLECDFVLLSPVFHGRALSWCGGLQRPLSHKEGLSISFGFSSLYLESQLPHRSAPTPTSTTLALSVKGLTRWQASVLPLLTWRSHSQSSERALAS